MMDKQNYKTEPFVSRTEKPWGYELVFAPQGTEVTGKILHVNKGQRASLQCHEEKTEVLILISGRAGLLVEDNNGVMQEVEMEPKKGYLIRPYQKHRYWGIEDCDIFEASTKEKGKTVRLEDDYGRKDEIK